MKLKSKKLKFKFGVLLSVLGIAVLVVGYYGTTRSSLFTIQVLELSLAHEDNPKKLPLSAEQIRLMTGIVEHESNLFEINLSEVNKKLRSHPWIKDVFIKKIFPQTISISVDLRSPVAIIQNETGSLMYVDDSLSVFGPVDLELFASLPVIAGLQSHQTEVLKEAVDFILGWKKYSQTEAEVSSLTFDHQLGLELMMVLKDKGIMKQRFILMMSQNSDTKLSDLARVIKYLKSRSIHFPLVRVTENKKIVVKISRGS